MVRVRKLKRPPIAEALVDLRVVPSEGDPIERLSALRDAVASDFTSIQPLQQVQFSLPDLATTGGPVSAGVRLHGYLLKAEGRNRLLQIRRDGLTVNQLPPYPDWAVLRPLALAWLGTYLEHLKPRLIQRVALRYINRIELPSPARVDRYITSFPAPPRGCPKVTTGVWSRISTESSEGGIRAVVTQALEAGSSRDRQTVLFDIDCAREQDAGLEPSDLEAVLEALHDLKNRIFFSSITEAMAKKLDEA